LSIDLEIGYISEHLSDAAFGYRTWQAALDRICDKAGATGAAFLPLKGSGAKLPASSGCAEIAERYVRDEWFKIDARAPSIPIIQRKGFATDQNFMTMEQMERNAYYQENLRPFGLRWFVALRIDGFERQWTLSLHRSEAEGPFQESEIKSLLSLSPSLSMAVALTSNVTSFAAISAFEAFSLSGKAVVMLDRFGDVIRVTEAAESLFNESLGVRNRRIVASCRQSAALLQLAISQSSRQPDDGLNHPILIRRYNSTPILAYVSPAKGVARDVFAQCQTYVILIDPYLRNTPAEHALQDLFGLTRTEAVLAARLSRGESLRDIASAMVISYETARTHLRRIFGKTGLNDQADLISFLSRVNAEQP
jgi:DNA-binding CsgD family transcriptional regulator